jgi:hypothetical protein
MPDFRQDLERKSERFELAPGALDRLFERRRRKQRNIRIRAAVLALVVGAAGTWGAVSALREIGTERRPAEQPSRPESYSLIAGAYTVTLEDDDRVVRANGLAGTYTMRLLPNGVMLLSVPKGGFGREGPSPSGISFRLSGNQFTTNAFVNLTCAKTVGVYRWLLRGNRLTLTPLQEPCDVRAALFGSRPWQRER